MKKKSLVLRILLEPLCDCYSDENGRKTKTTLQNMYKTDPQQRTNDMGWRVWP